MDDDQLQQALLLDGPDIEDLLQVACAKARKGCTKHFPFLKSRLPRLSSRNGNQEGGYSFSYRVGPATDLGRSGYRPNTLSVSPDGLRRQSLLHEGLPIREARNH